MIGMLLTALIAYECQAPTTRVRPSGVLAIVGLICWGVGQIPGIPPIVKTVIYVVIGVVILLWLLQFVGGHGVVFR